MESKKDTNHQLRRGKGCVKMQCLLSLMRIMMDVIQAEASIATKIVSRIDLSLHPYLKPSQAWKTVVPEEAAAMATAEVSVRKNRQPEMERLGEVPECEKPRLRMAEEARKVKLMMAMMECWGHGEKRE